MYIYLYIHTNLNPKLIPLVAEFISSPNLKVYTFSFIVGKIIPESVKCIHSASKFLKNP